MVCKQRPQTYANKKARLLYIWPPLHSSLLALGWLYAHRYFSGIGWIEEEVLTEHIHMSSYVPWITSCRTHSLSTFPTYEALLQTTEPSRVTETFDVQQA
ncbi:hypothetical protein BCR43DRAFT_195790 [Syncephalastrum racemosum]|uniref:Uncharacterized protein n=1 Tax=Syncephalastrum racemosum TaxID=13706 RepID=A0A1X2HHF9_SYNRA|nr:hypothetical protein BCR43DRAFT_195790 [Syncephalastrum racemosum]